METRFCSEGWLLSLRVCVCVLWWSFLCLPNYLPLAFALPSCPPGRRELPGCPAATPELVVGDPAWASPCWLCVGWGRVEEGGSMVGGKTGMNNSI